jgi:pimeloyl-ACP methyl ester carboxylesterase
MQPDQTNPTSRPGRPLSIVALHGNGGGAFRFARIKPYIPNDISFRAVTLPGFADVPRDPTLETMRDYAGDLYRLIAAEARPLILLGHGIGGSIILEFGQHFASAVDGLILHAPVGARLEARFFPKLMALPVARRIGQRLFSARLPRPFFRRLLFSKPVPAAYVNRFFDEYRHCTVFAQMFDLITPGWFAALRPVDLPAALLWGEQERLLHVDQVRDYQALLPNSLVRTVPGWRHFPMIEQPEAYAGEIVVLARELVDN